VSSSNKRKIFLIDNFDSFTYNLVNQLKPMVDELVVYRNDVDFEKMCDIIDNCNSKKVIVLSPGPGNPNTAGNTLKLIQRYQASLPILGICLGHQAIIQSFEGIIGAAKSIVHGKAESIFLESDEPDIFAQLTSPFIAARYHSLAATKVPDSLKVIATSADEVMAIKHKRFKILGFQFHPESILTPKGGELLNNSLNWLMQD
jgi:anthranilate synthase component II